MADISKITLPSGTTYNIKDAQARSDIAAMSASKIYIGESQTAITDGATIAEITVLYNGNTSTVIPVAGQFVTRGAAEYVVGQDNVWHKFGDTSDHGKLAYKDSATGKVTAAGSVSQPSFTGTKTTITTSITPKGSVAISTAAPAGSQAATYTPSGTVSKPTFSGTAGTVNVSGTPKGTVSIGTGTGTANYTPAGSVSVTPTVTMNTATVNSITDVGTLPSLTTSVSGETLTIGWSAGTLPTKGANTTVATSVKSATATGSFTGTGVQLTGSFTGQASSSSGSFTPSGTVSQPSFTGMGVMLNGNFTGQASSGSATYTPAGTVSQPTFTGSAVDVTVQ